MIKLCCKWVICICIVLSSNSAFAAALSSVEIVSDGNYGKIYLNTDKSVVNKKNISENQIQIKLKNTNITENLKTTYNNAPQDTEISMIQNGKNAYINICGQNIANYELLYAKDGSLIPTKNGKKDVLIAFAIFAGIAFVSLLSRKVNQNYPNLSLNMENLHTQTLIQQKNQIKEINTLRNKINKINNNSIHGNPVKHFADNYSVNSVTVPAGFRKSDFDFIEYPNTLKKAVNS